MIDQNEISDDEFSQTTSTYLNRLSYLLLQLDDRGTSTRKDMKIREVSMMKFFFEFFINF